MVIRKKYLERLNNLKDTNLIKILIGVRRCGKSTILQQFINQIKKENIIFYNFESFENEAYLNNWKLFYSSIKNQLKKNRQNYIFLDEVQNVKDWQKVVDSLFVLKNIDIYITGSNAYLLSSELATLLSGRYIEINVFPFSFAEFYSQFTTLSQKDMFEKYILYGGFPEVSNFIKKGIISEINPYLDSLSKTIIENDINTRNNFRNTNELLRVLNFVLDSIGSELSFTNIANSLYKNMKNIKQVKNNDYKMSVHTVDKYVLAFTNSFILHKVLRYDIRGKQLLKTLQKYYAVDIGLINSILGKEANYDYGHLLENIVFLELKRRYKNVNIGKIYNKEIDFVATDYNGEVTFFQVAWITMDSITLKRELKPLENIKNHNAKILLTTDIEETNYNGIKKRNVIKWLVE